MTPAELLKEYAFKVDVALAEGRRLAAGGEWMEAMSKINQASWWITASMWTEEQMEKEDEQPGD